MELPHLLFMEMQINFIYYETCTFKEGDDQQEFIAKIKIKECCKKEC
jgi:hypothetical protein